MKSLRILKKPVKKPLVVILVKRTVFFFFIMSFLTMGLYISGNFNDFMDVTQRLLLRTAGTTGVCLFFFVTIGVILDLFMIFHMKLTYAVGFIFYVIVGGIGALITLTTLFIQTLTVG